MVAQVQRPAPTFSAPGVNHGEIVANISLSDYRGRYVVFFWYPMDFTFVCPTEVIAFNDAREKFQKLDCDVIAASGDSEYVHKAWIETPRDQGGLGKETVIPIVADKTRRIATDYGIYLDQQGIALRGLFIIDPNGIIRHITINDLPIGRSVNEALRLVESLKHTEKHGEVCPANWSKGEKAITPDSDKAKKFFKKYYSKQIN